MARNSTDGAWVAPPGNVHSSSSHVDRRADVATKTCLLRIDIRAIDGQPLDLTALSPRITVNGTGVLWDGEIRRNPAPAGLFGVAVQEIQIGVFA